MNRVAPSKGVAQTGSGHPVRHLHSRAPEQGASLSPGVRGHKVSGIRWKQCVCLASAVRREGMVIADGAPCWSEAARARPWSAAPAQLLPPRALRAAQEGRRPVWEGTLLLVCGGWNLRSLGRLKLLPEADLSSGLLTNAHHLIRVTFASEFHTHPLLWRERERKDCKADVARTPPLSRREK